MKYTDSDHKYTHNGEQYISMTTLLKKFHQPKDWNKIAQAYLDRRTADEVVADLAKKWKMPLKKAKEKWPNPPMTASWIRSVWKEKSNNALRVGSTYHDWREDQLIEKGAKGNKIVDDQKKAFDLSSLTPGIYPELVCYSHKHKIAGQADKIIITKSGKNSIIRDYKTSETIDMEEKAYFRKELGRKTVERFLPPISHLATINYNEYALQLSGYGYILEMYGFPPIELVIEHVIFSDKAAGIVDRVVDIPVPYLRKEVRAIFNHYKKSRR